NDTTAMRNAECEMRNFQGKVMPGSELTVTFRIPNSPFRIEVRGRKEQGVVRRALSGKGLRVPPPRARCRCGCRWAPRRAGGRPRVQHLLALGGETVSGAAARRGRRGRALQTDAPGSRARLCVALKRSGAGVAGAGLSATNRVHGARSDVRAAPPALRRGRQGL